MSRNFRIDSKRKNTSDFASIYMGFRNVEQKIGFGKGMLVRLRSLVDNIFSFHSSKLLMFSTLMPEYWDPISHANSLV